MKMSGYRPLDGRAGSWLGPTLLMALGLIVALQPLILHGQPRSSEAWIHLRNLEEIPNALAALNYPRMLRLFHYRQHYTKYPLFYAAAKAAGVHSPLQAAAFAAAVFSVLPLLTYLLASRVLGRTASFIAGLVVAVSPSFVYTMNFFSGGEPLALAAMLLGLYLYEGRRPLWGLAFFIPAVLLHPLTSLFLWVFLIVDTLLSKSSKESAERVLCTLLFSAAFICWVFIQIYLGLPLGYVMSRAAEGGTIVALGILITAGAMLVWRVRRRWGRLERAMLLASDAISDHLAQIVVAAVVGFLALFVSMGVPGSEQRVQPAMLLFYLPLLAAIFLAGLRRDSLDRMTTSLVLAVLALGVAGTLIFPHGIPVYRLAPYGTVALALLIAPILRERRILLIAAAVTAGLAATAYPPGAFYFGFEEQYYPADYHAAEKAVDTAGSGRIITDTRMENVLRFLGAPGLVVPTNSTLNALPGDHLLITWQMEEYGFYPPGAQWYRVPFHVDLSEIRSKSDQTYSNGAVKLLLFLDEAEPD